MSDLRRTPIHRALHRPNLLMGGERKPVLLLLLMTLGLAVTSMNLVTAAISLVLYLFAIFNLRQMAKADAYMTGIYLRSLNYRGYYAPRSRPSRDR